MREHGTEKNPMGLKERLIKLEAKRSQEAPPPEAKGDVWTRAQAGDPDAIWRLQRVQQIIDAAKARKERADRERASREEKHSICEEELHSV